MITVVASAGAIAALGCTFLGWITNCVDDCGDVCEHGVKKATEGHCGTCTCECYPPPPPPRCDDKLIGKNALISEPCIIDTGEF